MPSPTMLRASETEVSECAGAYSTRGVSPCLRSALVSNGPSCRVDGGVDVEAGRSTPTVPRTRPGEANLGGANRLDGTSTPQAATGEAVPEGRAAGSLLSLELQETATSATTTQSAATETGRRRTRTGISPDHAAPGLPGREPPASRLSTGAGSCSLR